MAKQHQPNEFRVDVTARHGHLSEHSREYVTKKATKLLRFNDRITRIQVLTDDPQGDREVEMIVHVDAGATFVAKERAAGLHEAVDLLVEKMERQIKKDKERLKDHKIDGGRGVGPAEPLDEPEETYDDVVRKDLGP